MKKFVLLLILLIVLFVGCKSMDYYYACKGDVDCMAIMKKNGNLTSSIVSTAVDTVPQTSGFGQLCGYIAGGLVSLITGVIVGRKVKK